MELAVPRKARLAQIEPYYLRSGRVGRLPYSMDTILRIHLLQQWYALSDPGMDEALREIASMRLFARLSGLDAIPDETTILNFRRLLERHELAAKMLEAVNAYLARNGQTKNADKARDPEMLQTRKGNQWYLEIIRK